ncbi:MAG: hypothetical protein FWE65_00345 [Eggerthellaceae bacterium]|nr:hypothetical protein [Eggerthellaceae bacterium]
MKKLFVLALGFVLAFVLVGLGCTYNEPEPEDPTTNTPATPPVENEPLASQYAADGLTVRYPVSWNRNENPNGTVYIYPPKGGMFYIDTKKANTNPAVRSDSSAAVLDNFYYGVYDSLNKGFSKFSFLDHNRRVQGQLVYETSSFKVNIEDVDYEGYLYIGLSGTRVYTVMVMVPRDYFPYQQETLLNVINSVVVIPQAQDQTPPASSGSGTSGNSTQGGN